MREELEILNELHGLDGALKKFPPNVHWFCPKQHDDDYLDYTNLNESEGDIDPEKKKEILNDSKKRHEVAYKCSLVLGLAPEQAGRMLEEYTQRLNQLLSSCDKCVYNWHLGRRAFLKELSEQFDDEIVAGLTRRLNKFDFQRIDKGLEIAHNLLSKVDISKRTQSYLALNDTAALIALYEAICCVDFHKDDSCLAKHFDFVFASIQNRKVLRISDILPAMTRFLFSRDQIRQNFGRTSWRKLSNPLTTMEFEWVVHDVLMETMILVALPNADPIDIENFWVGSLLMLKKMDEFLMTHSLSGMEVQPSIYHLALQHLHCNSSEIVQPVIESIYVMLEVAPKAFWSAMGTISPFTVVELVLKSPGFSIMLKDPRAFEDGDKSVSISWIPTFLNSLTPIHQYDACRALCLYLFDRLQNGEFLSSSRMKCLHAGLKSLHTTLQTFTSSEYRINASTSLIVIGDIMGLVDNFKVTITSCADLSETDERSIKLKAMGRAVIQSVLTLDCKAVSSEWAALVASSEVQRGSRNHSQDIWQAVLDIFRPGSIDLAKNILPSTNLLIGIDELRPEHKRYPERLPVNHVQFNKDLHELMDNVARIFERLSDFSAEDLKQLPQESTTARPLFAALISSDRGVHEAAVELIKSLTGQDGRQDALKALLETDFSSLLGSLNAAVIKVSYTKTFGPTPYIIKIGRELLCSLCGSTGLLRSRCELSKVERNTILGWWTSQWRALDVIFSCTEEWGEQVDKPTSEMTDFLRDAMEYSEALFNEYNIFAYAINGLDCSIDHTNEVKSLSKESITKVLNIICQNINGFVGMLRLRDYYLISVAVNLLVKLLSCLGDFDLEVHEYASKFIKDACKGENQVGYRKTNLSNQQKAELRRALDEHQGIEFIEESKATVKKQASIQSWSKSADGKLCEPKLPPKSRDLLSSKNLKNRSSLAEIRSRPTSLSVQDAISKQSVTKFKERRRQAEEEARRNKADAIARAKALRAPNGVKGEGSGLKDIDGITGKDHAPKSSELLCGSSDSESEEEEEEEEETNALINLQKTRNSKVSDYEASRRLNLLKLQGPTKKIKVQRSAKDLRARVEPNMDKLYIEILNWDLFHQGDEPPGSSNYRKIDNKYLDLDLYKSTFGPLLISEVWRSLVTSKEENNFKPMELKILNRLSVDKFIEISTSMPIPARDPNICERDIVLLSKSTDPLKDKEEPHCLARVDRRTRKNNVIEITYRVSRDLRQELLQCLVPNGKLFVVKITDMTTTQREYAALSSLEYYDLCNEVLEAKPSPHQIFPEKRISSTAERYHLNIGQSKAVLSAYENDGFTLIQGPPGSGKTKTIIAMVGALLSQTLLQQQQHQKVESRPNNSTVQKSPVVKKKLLICAPSNAAVDELVVRLMEGVQPWNGSTQKINLIRIGRSDAINASVKDVVLDELVTKKLEGDLGEKTKHLSDREKLHQDAAKVKERLNVIRPLIDEARKNGESNQEINLRREFDQLKRNQASIGAKIDEEKASGNTVSRQNEIKRRQFQQEIIDGAHVICSTLSGSGHDMFRNLNVEFETVIIDEAAQCIELSALIPLKYGCSKCILVGDPEQLPPTVLSRSAARYGYEQSLFVRMQRNYPKDVHLLDTQYRMHPEISIFPSQEFYASRLIDGDNMAALRDKPWHISSTLAPYRFFDVKGTQTKEASGHSFINLPEINASIALYERLKTDFYEYDFKGQIGIITTYKAQLIEMRARFERRFGNEIHEEIEFNTTDAFQGREREIIIFSCVRAKSSGGIGFLGDIRRMNVGLTRAKSSLWVLGDSLALQQGEYWNKLIQNAKDRDRYTGGDIFSLLRRRTIRDRDNLQRTQMNKASNSHLGQQKSLHTENINSVQCLSKVNDDIEDVKISNTPASLDHFENLINASENNLSNVKQISSQAQNVQKPHVIAAGEKIMDENSLAMSRDSHEGILGKRPRDFDSAIDEVPSKKISNLNPKTSKLEAALAAHEASKAAAPIRPVRPMRPPGVAPPRRKAPADPFIKKKLPPPKR